MISVVVPVLDEAEALAGALEALALQDTAHEVVVADGGSADDTWEVARKGGATIVESARGRARQMNAGAAASIGETLLFLHADTTLPAGALAAVERALADERVVGGGFLKRYDGRHPLLALSAALQNGIRARVRCRFVGTQAMFVRRSVFERMGGYRDLPFLEDVDLSDRLLREGGVVALPLHVSVSARRYRTRGTLRQLGFNGLIVLLYRAGVAPHRLRTLYARRDGR